MSEYEIRYLLYVLPSLLVILGFGLFLILKKDKGKA